MTSPPATVVIGAHTYTVKSDAATSHDLALDGKLGSSQMDRLELWVDGGRPRSVMAETLVHEILHCIWDSTALRAKDDDEEEAVITSLAPLLFATIRDNPKLVAFLTAG